MTSAVLVLRLNVALIATLLLAACDATMTSPSQVSATPVASLAIETNAVWHLRSIAAADKPVLTIEDPLPFTLLLTQVVRHQVSTRRASRLQPTRRGKPSPSGEGASRDARLAVPLMA